MAQALLGAVAGGLIGLIVYVMREMNRERKEWAKERATLLQRIQAPQMAVVEHHNEGPVHAPQSVPPDDDDAHWANQPITKDELAELAMRMENGG